ncbi:hypothetical protein [Streptomyces sp. NEAU-sy36]|uniref:hypothetical protein n=2 Tax=unclassified Streptomyces TaxID=2593676 RepID=UPI001C57C206|nr:hypothetical protein [Streptomyces sp. NEAU-sy36]
MPDDDQRLRICTWLTANGINPNNVTQHAPIHILPIPVRPPETGDGWLAQVIVFTECYVNADGHREQNLISREPVTFQRTVPLRVPFPANLPGNDGGEEEAV